MAEQNVEMYRIALGRGSNGFFCPVSKVHLVGGVTPHADWPAAAPLTTSVKAGLRARTLVDVHGTIPFEAFATKTQLAELAAKKINAAKTTDDDEDFDIDDDPKGSGLTGDKLTEEQIDATKKKELLAYIADQGINTDTLSIDGRSKEDDIRNALKIHFGYKTV